MNQLSQWIAVFVVCGPYNICAVQNDPQPYWTQSDCQSRIKIAVDESKADLPKDYRLDGNCLKINSGIKL